LVLGLRVQFLDLGLRDESEGVVTVGSESGALYRETLYINLGCGCGVSLSSLELRDEGLRVLLLRFDAKLYRRDKARFGESDWEMWRRLARGAKKVLRSFERGGRFGRARRSQPQQVNIAVRSICSPSRNLVVSSSFRSAPPTKPYILNPKPGL